MKKVFIIILSVLLVLAPTVAFVSAYFYFKSADPQVVSTDLVSAVVRDEKGNEKLYRSEDVFFEIFAGMFGDGETNVPQALVALPQEALNYVKYSVRFVDNFGVESSYTYYLSSDSKKCYYTDADNRAYNIAKNAAEAFLNSDFSESVYDLAAPPVVTIGETVLTPYTLDWKYKTVGGTLKNASCSYSDKNESATIENFLVSFLLDSTLQPDEIALKILDAESKEQLYSGSYAGLKKFSLEGSKTVTVDMTLVWKNNVDKDYAGSAKYFFTGKLFGIPAFSISKNEATCGDVVVLSAYNVMSAEDLKVQIEPSLNYDPVFYKVGDGWQALLPLSVDAVNEGSTTFSVTMNSASATDVFLLKVNALQKGTYRYDDKNFENYYNDTVLSNMNQALGPIAKAPSAFSFVSGKFVVPAKDNYYSDTSNYAFGTTVTLVPIKKSFTALDTMYCAYSNYKDGKYVEGTKTKVLAAFDGTVVYVGAQTYTGRIVVIDHGSGLKSWYTNLSSDIQVKEGDQVTAGQVISSAADGGLNSSLNFNFHVGVTVNGVAVNIKTLIDEGLIAKQR